MLPTTPELASLLDAWRNDTSVEVYVAALYTFTLSGGEKITWSGEDQDIAWNGQTYVRGPGIAATPITRQIGTQVSQKDISLVFDDTVSVNGVGLAKFLASGGLFNATMLFESAYAYAPDQPIIGTLAEFSGRVTQLKDCGETRATITVSNWMSLLNVQVPINLWQPPCLHTLFDSGCKLDRSQYAKNGVVQGMADPLTIATDLSAADGYYNLGKIVFTSGENEGQSRAVKTQSGGIVSMVRALPALPVQGDTFTIYPGCDLTMATCAGRFNNIQHFKGQPYIPTNEMAAP